MGEDVTGFLPFQTECEHDGGGLNKLGDLPERLRAALGDARVHMFWDNTGGPIADTVYDQMADHGRVVVCGDISSYTPGAPKGDLEHRNHTILERRLRVEGILVTEYFPRMGDAIPTLVKLHSQGKLQARSHVVKGFENTVDAFWGLFTGSNTGKTLVEL